ncbi:MAG: PfkB family carbohydrate kinase, partial [Pseudomonadota bacterium]|nr:PfkB family carbohydrate kinase [Pseudomonadota bacterium]
MSQNLPDFSNLSICVIGDIMLDEYLHGATQRISPEAPVPVVLKSAQNHCLGGAANVANNLAKLGIKASLAGILGEDEAGETIRQALKAQGINDHCLYHGEAQTIHKLRIMSRSQQLLRIDKEQPFSSQLSDQLISQLISQLDHFDAIILSDYAKGTLQKLSTLISAASAKGIPVIVDPKGQDFTKYTGASAITPNLSEFEAIQGKSADNETFNQKAQALKSELKLDALIVTLS